MMLLMESLKRKVTALGNLKSEDKALPQDPLNPRDVSSAWVKEAFERKLRLLATNSTRESDSDEEPKGLRKCVEKMAMKDLSMKHYVALLEVAPMTNHDCGHLNCQVESIRYFLTKNSVSSEEEGFIISFQGYRSFRAQLKDHFISRNSYSCLWILKWFPVKIFVQLCTPELRAHVPLSLLLEYLEKKINFYYYRVEQLHLGINSALPVRKIRLNLSHVSALKDFGINYLNFEARLSSKKNLCQDPINHTE